MRLRIRDVTPGEIVYFEQATVIDPQTGQSTLIEGFTGQASREVVRFGDGTLRRLFVDIDPDLCLGFEALWVEVKENPAEDLFASVARVPAQLEQGRIILFSQESEISTLRIGAATLNQVRAWAANKLSVPDDLVFVSEVLAEWVVERDAHSDIFFVMLEADKQPVHCLMRNDLDPGGSWMALLIDSQEWSGIVKRYSHKGGDAFREATEFIVSLAHNDALWESIWNNPTNKGE